ncbi:Enhancer of polycomb homolog 1-like [Caenorhabditis elegans]|uniref:Enhancer of polycomb homolog 1-like n=1 Tax=Caenorhabditis elegans TaxID=6239 RepID=Q9TYN6_CAEEL|nr:Enhancer of polycomb homolog 1-like [Caenorhabditis elegans]CCD61340.1 Enhancer of polycomb homolog 1-like [Caenorhabditis elegans]|eukprot:NP_500375.2 Uncharacterized protein CELE_Y37E11B.2 [Caenorhabditis elegans]
MCACFSSSVKSSRGHPDVGMETLLPPDRVLNLQPRSMPSLKPYPMQSQQERFQSVLDHDDMDKVMMESPSLLKHIDPLEYHKI